jgi:hypothetical protein
MARVIVKTMGVPTERAGRMCGGLACARLCWGRRGEVEVAGQRSVLFQSSSYHARSHEKLMVIQQIKKIRPFIKTAVSIVLAIIRHCTYPQPF